MGIESAQRILRILASLQTEGILGWLLPRYRGQSSQCTETFLPFDLDSTFSSITIVYMAHAADNQLVADVRLWSGIADEIFREMVSTGNRVAGCLKSETEHFRNLLDQLPATDVPRQHKSSRRRRQPDDVARRPGPERTDSMGTNPEEMAAANEYSIPGITPGVPLLVEDIDWQDGFTTENLMTMADSLDLDGLDWLSTSTLEMMT